MKRKRENSLQSAGDSSRKSRKLGKLPIMAFEWTYAMEIIYLKNVVNLHHHRSPYVHALDWSKGGWYQVFDVLSKLEGFSVLRIEDLVTRVAHLSHSYAISEVTPTLGIATEQEYLVYHSFKDSIYPPPSMDNAPKGKPKRIRPVYGAVAAGTYAGSRYLVTVPKGER